MGYGLLSSVLLRTILYILMVTHGMDGLVQYRSDPIANTTELLQSCI